MLTTTALATERNPYAQKYGKITEFGFLKRYSSNLF
jgi:hypothetical protein